MADPKGPETGQTAKGAPSARPRSPTLDLAATDVTPKGPSTDKDTPKPSTDKPASDQPASAAAPKPEAPLRPEAPSGAAAAAPSAASSGATRPPAPSPSEKPAQEKPAQDKPAQEKPAEAAKPAADQPRPAAARTGAADVPPRFTTPPASAAPVASGGVGFFGMLVSALAGAALALLGVALFGKELIGVAQPDMSRVNAVESKLGAIGSDVSALRADIAKAKPVDASAFEAKFGELSKSVEAAGGRVGGVETELKALSDQIAKPAAQDPAIAVVAGRLDGLELRFQEAPTADQVAVLTSRIAGIEARSKDLPTKDTLADLSVRLDDLGQTVDGVDKKIGAATAPLSSKVDQVAETLKARPKGDPTARLVVALGALDQALGEGRPFAAELQAVKAAAGGNDKLASLDAQAAKGLPTRATLGADLAAEIARLAPVKPVATGSILDRLAASAGGVVKITPKDAAAGSDPAALRARVAELGASGDIEGALAARGSLDEAARAATEEWAALASARVSAEDAIGSARTAALARLTTND
ncbi:hypothetical protein [Methylopila sp. M107]|uniref:COG4223 family protein n=1 Tax=Methylopila sp. M107 TaxID=1101190 RepID=UPI0003794ACD|nr:hypothetical protein [Methylopila sp. M107]